MPPVELVLPDGSVYPQKGKVQLVAGQFDNSVGAISFGLFFQIPKACYVPVIPAKFGFPNLLRKHWWYHRKQHLKYRIKYLYLQWATVIK